MAPSTQILLSGALTFGAPLLLALCELVALRRARRGPDDGGLRRDDAAPTPPSPLSPGGAPPQERLPPLPDCLIEAARGLPGAAVGPAKAGRVLETV